MSAEQMTRAERIAYHAARVREALVQAQHPTIRAWPDAAGGVLDRLAQDHAREAAHAARSSR